MRPIGLRYATPFPADPLPFPIALLPRPLGGPRLRDLSSALLLFLEGCSGAALRLFIELSGLRGFGLLAR
jgi:hypothetical protein